MKQSLSQATSQATPRPAAVFLSLFFVALTACGGDTVGLEDYSVEYRDSRDADALEVPPGLSSASIEDSMAIPGATSYSALEQQRAEQNPAATDVLPVHEDIEVVRDGDKRWLVVNMPAGEVWPKLREFWLQLGFLLNLEDAQIGVMETDWKENRADIEEGFLRDIIGSVLDNVYASPTRDSFRTRIEESDRPDSTEVFISHRGVLEKLTREFEGETVWDVRPSEPELEAEMLRRLMVFLGADDEAARARLAQSAQKLRASLVKDRDDNPVINYRTGFPRAWRTVGLALDRIGFAVEGRDRSKGLYQVRYSDPLADTQGGVFSGLFGGDETPADQYQVNLVGDEVSTQIIVLDKDGARDTSDTAARILALLFEQIR